MNKQEKYRDSLFYQSSVLQMQNAKNLRKASTPAENKLWQILRGGKMDGHKFRRQHVIGQFIVDFYCHESKLVIEVDGEIHNLIENKRYDKTRTLILSEGGIKILRFTNQEVLYSIEKVATKILKTFNELKALTPNLSPHGEGSANAQGNV